MFDGGFEFFQNRVDQKVRDFFGQFGQVTSVRRPRIKKKVGIDFFKFIAAGAAAAAISTAPAVQTSSISLANDASYFQSANFLAGGSERLRVSGWGKIPLPKSADRDWEWLLNSSAASSIGDIYFDTSSNATRSDLLAAEPVHALPTLQSQLVSLLEEANMSHFAFPDSGNGVYIEAGDPSSSLTVFFESAGASEGLAMYADSRDSGGLISLRFNGETVKLVADFLGQYKRRFV